MFAQQNGQHATYFYSDPANTANYNEPLGSSGSWDTPFSSPEELGLGSTNFLPKGAGGDRGSPLSHLPSFDRMASGVMPAALTSMGSLSLADQSAFFQVNNLSELCCFEVSFSKPELEIIHNIAKDQNQTAKM